MVSIAPYTTAGLRKMRGTLIPTSPGHEPEALAALGHDGEVTLDGAA